MKKIVSVFIMSLVLLSGCSSKGYQEKNLDFLSEYDGLSAVEKYEKAFEIFAYNINSATIKTTLYDKRVYADIDDTIEEINYYENYGTNHAHRRKEISGSGYEFTFKEYECKEGIYSNFESNDKNQLIRAVDLTAQENYDTAKNEITYAWLFEQNNYEDNDIQIIPYEDGSFDLKIESNLADINESERLYYEELDKTDEFNGFIEKEEIITQIKKECTYTISDYLIYHINEKGIITEIESYNETCFYEPFIFNNEQVLASKNEEKTIISDINSTVVNTDDVIFNIKEELNVKDKFTTTLSPEETDKLESGDVISQYPDIETLIKKDLYYKLNERTGEITFCPLEVGYRSWSDTWDNGGTCNCAIEVIEDPEIIKLLEELPGFKEAKENNPFEGRIDYLGNGQWSY